MTSLFSRLQNHDPRRFLRCDTCRDFGMIESGDSEDVCPTCEGGIWREREPWGYWLNRRLPGFRVMRGWPFVYLTSRP